MSYCISSSNDYVLLKNNLPIDDLKNPRQAIQNIFIAWNWARDMRELHINIAQNNRCGK